MNNPQTLANLQALCYVAVGALCWALTAVVLLKFVIPQMTGLKPVHIDGTLYVLIGMFGAINTVFTTDDAYKYVNAYCIFWIKAAVDIALAGVGSLKMFRSTTYAEHLAGKLSPAVSIQPQPPADPAIPKGPTT